MLIQQLYQILLERIIQTVIIIKNRRPPWCAELMGSEGGHIGVTHTHKNHTNNH